MNYLLTEDPNTVVLDGTSVPRGSCLWQDYEYWCSQGNVAAMPEPPAVTQEQVLENVDKAVEAWLDAFVSQRNYKSIESCISYVGDDDPYFAAEGVAARRWRSAVYRACRDMMASPPPGVTPESILQYLPQPEAFDWPIALVQPIGLASEPEEASV